MAPQSVCLAGAAATASTDGSERQSFQALLIKLDAAEKGREFDTWSKLIRQHCTPTAIFSQFNQPLMTLADEIDGERTMLGSVGHIKLDSEHLVAMTFSGKYAKAIVTYTIDAQGPAGKPDLMQSDLLTYKLVQTNGKWLIESVTIKPEPVLGGKGSAT